MKRDGLENVHTEKVTVPRWIRGHESVELVEPVRDSLVMLGLGNSIGTPPDGIQAEVLVVHGFSELEANASRVKGRIVLFNAPYTSYPDSVAYRLDGPSHAAQLGAVATLVRSIGPPGLRTPHTGALQYHPPPRRFRPPRSRPRMPIALNVWPSATPASSRA